MSMCACFYKSSGFCSLNALLLSRSNFLKPCQQEDQIAIKMDWCQLYVASHTNFFNVKYKDA